MASTGEVWRLGHRPALDGLRGVAVLLVVVSHFGTPGMSHAGAVGVTAFFVLSGFLITTLLLEERERTGTVALRAFYVRRARRLMPALLACLAVTIPLGVAAGLLTTAEAVAAVTYTTNFFQVGAAQIHGLLGHTWSLAIEEQFYLLWPIVAVLIRRRSVMLTTLATGVALTLAWRVLLAEHGASGPRLAYGLDTQAGGLLIGCLLAVVLVGRPVSVAPRWLAPASLAGLVAIALPATTAWTPMLASACSVGLIWSAVQGAPPRWLNGPALRYVGRRSYGLYLWHYPVALLIGAALPWWLWWERALIVAPLSLALTVASWRYVESPFLRRSHQADTAGSQDAPCRAGRPDRPRAAAVLEGKRLDIVAG